MDPPSRQQLPIVDLGSNTARLVVFEYQPGEWFQLRDSIREPVRLGAGLVAHGALSEAAIDRAEAAIRLFADFADGSRLEPPRVLCTSAVREAANQQEFLARLEPMELTLEVLPGEEEASLGVTAVANGFPFDDAWVVDMGGGSAQVSEMRRRRFRRGRAYPLGAIRLTERFLASDPPTGAEVGELERYLDGELAGAIESIRESDGDLVAMGGTIRNLARALQVETGYPLDLLHNYEVELEPFEALTEKLLALDAAGRAAKLAINPDRADLLPAGALLFRHLLRGSNRPCLRISGHGVREGAFFRRFLPAPHLLEDVTGFSVRNVAHQYGQTIPHVERVRHLATRLFDVLEPLHRLGQRDRYVLDAAATLHDIGMAVDYHRHHKHGAYLALTQPLPGFSHREQALISLLVRYHRKGTPGLGPYAPLMEGDDKVRLVQLSACLRMAEMLERARTGRIRDISGRISEERVVLSAHAEGEPVVELWEAQKHADLFVAAFGRPLELEARDVTRL